MTKMKVTLNGFATNLMGELLKHEITKKYNLIQISFSAGRDDVTIHYLLKEDENSSVKFNLSINTETKSVVQEISAEHLPIEILEVIMQYLTVWYDFQDFRIPWSKIEYTNMTYC